MTHMTSRPNVVLLTSAIADARIMDPLQIDLALAEFTPQDGGGSTSWVQIALEGKWQGHWMGAFSLNAAMFDQMVEHFDASPIDTVVDYDHSSVFGAAEAPAAGWLKALQRRGGKGEPATLWGQVQWTSKAAERIRSLEYRYLSPTIVFNTKDRKSAKLTGASLHSVALTNKPFLQELPEVRLNSLRAALGVNQHQEEEPMNREQFVALCKQLGLDPDTTTPEAAVAALTELQAEQAEQRAALREALGAGEADDLTAAAQALRVQATGAPDAAEVNLLRTQVQALNESQAMRDAQALVEEMQREGKVAATGTENYQAALDMALHSADRFKALMAAMPANSVAPAQSPVAPLGDRGHRAAGQGWVDDTEQLRAYALQLGLSDEDIKTLGQQERPNISFTNEQ